MPNSRRRYDAITRAARWQRLKLAFFGALIIAPILTLLAVATLPEQEIGQPELVRVVSTALRASDDTPRRLINVELASGAVAVITVSLLISPDPGDTICITRVRRPLVGRVTLRAARPDACEGL